MTFQATLLRNVHAGDMFPSEYNGTIFMTQHGSGNRKVALGFRIMTIGVDPDGEVLSYEIFAQGWLSNPAKREFWGEPCACCPLDALARLVLLTWDFSQESGMRVPNKMALQSACRSSASSA